MFRKALLHGGNMDKLDQGLKKYRTSTLIGSDLDSRIK